jgi:hypothetical protein
VRHDDGVSGEQDEAMAALAEHISSVVPNLPRGDIACLVALDARLRSAPPLRDDELLVAAAFFGEQLRARLPAASWDEVDGETLLTVPPADPAAPPVELSPLRLVARRATEPVRSERLAETFVDLVAYVGPVEPEPSDVESPRRRRFSPEWPPHWTLFGVAMAMLLIGLIASIERERNLLGLIVAVLGTLVLGLSLVLPGARYARERAERR